MIKSKFLIQIVPVILFGTISIVGINGCQSKPKLDLAIDRLRENSYPSWQAEELAKEFKQIGEPAVAKLLPFLEDKNWEVRGRTAYILGEMGESAKSAAPKLMPLLKENQKDHHAWDACGNAIDALGQMSAVPELIAALKKDWSTDTDKLDMWDGAVQERVATALTKIGKPSIPALITTLSDPNPSIRQRAASILGQIGATAKSAVPTLTKTLTDSDPKVRIAAASALGRIGEAAPAIATLTKTLKNSDPSIRRSAAWALGEMGTKAKSAVPTLTKTLTDSDPQVRVIAASALVQIEGATSIVFPIFTSALTGRDDSAKSRAIETLGEMGQSGTPAIPALLTVLKDPNPAADTLNRTKAAEALAAIGAEAQLIAALKDPNSIVRWRAAYALGKADYSSAPATTAVSALLTALEDPQVEVRRRAAEALGNMGVASETAIPALTAIAKDRDNPAKTDAEDALRQIDSALKVFRHRKQ
jgi:HEAT repeat protein